MEEIQARHRKELKELQGKITSKKKNASKKTRKGVNDECDRLERELKEKQQQEVAALAPSLGALDVDVADLSVNDKIDANNTSDDVDPVVSDQVSQAREVDDTPSQNGSTQSRGDGVKKPSRQRARQARKAAEQEAQMRAAEEEAANMPDQRQQELSAMKAQMDQRHLVETMIRPDGHCLYSACVHTIPVLDKKTYKDVRIAAADYMSAHPDNFAPFLEEPLSSYIHKIRDTAEWGGHLELTAIAKFFNTNINILQASGHVEEIRPEQESEQTAWLAYYRHSFGLGEHYNALTQAPPG